MCVSKPYVKCHDVMCILGCAQNKAYETIKMVNEYAVKKKLMPFPQGSANKYLFADLFGIPVADIDKILEEENRC